MEVALIIVGVFAVFAVLLLFTPLITTKMMKNNMNAMKKMTEEMSSGNMSDTLKELNKNAIKIKKDIMEEIRKNYPLQKNGKVIFDFPRLFFTIEK